MVRPSRLVCVLVRTGIAFFSFTDSLPSQGLLGNTSQEDEATVLSPSLLEALTVTMGEEVRVEELVDVPQRQLGARVDIDNDNLDKEQKRKMLKGVEE